jgi:thiol:disulfide interchange protein
MKSNARGVLVLVGVLVLSFVSACSQQESPGMRDGSTPVRSRIDLDRLAAQSQAQGKNVYMEFSAPWCHFCQKFHRDVLYTSESQQALRKVIFVKADFDRDKALAHYYGVRSIPSGVLLKNQNGRLQVIDRHTGGLDQAAFIRFLSR